MGCTMARLPQTEAHLGLSTSYNLYPAEQRDIPFIFTQEILIETNILMSNGMVLADATGDTMLDIGGLNP